MMAVCALSMAGVCAAAPATGQLLRQFEKKVTEFTLANGMHFILVERHDAPVVSFHSYVNSGAVDDPSGDSGIAHMMEHMAFKGTSTIGTKNYPAEKKAIAEIEQLYDQYDRERNKGFRADAHKMAALKEELKAAMAKAETYVDSNAFPRIIEENGGVGLNAETDEDSTEYYYSLPSNRIELWFLLESERFIDPVFREFYKERDVVREERRMRAESNPQGKLVETLLATAFAAHPYRVPAGGWASDIENFRLTDAVDFYKKHYVPANITIGIAGDVNPAEARRFAEKYFGRIPAGPPPPVVVTEEPPQEGEKRVKVEAESQPFLAIAYKRPSDHDKDDPALNVLSDILSSGRTSLLYTELVRDQKLALGAFAAAELPGGKYPNLFVFYLIPNLGHTVEENEKACYDIIERMKIKKVDAETLERVKTKVRASLIRKLDSNSGLAAELPAYYATHGDWRRLFTDIDEIEQVTADDVMRVAKQYLTAENRTVAYIVPPGSEEKADAQKEAK
ncbi:MAG TPA: pitrilysin family protein [Bryobacteraceae bacterium]|nr:pitrilysin family protein [Bryobacteraceae bacterium]